MNKLKGLFRTLLNVILPKSKEVIAIESSLKQHGASILKKHESLRDEIYTLYNFQDKDIRTIIHEIKYRRNKELADYLAPEILAHITQIFIDECIGEYEKPILTWIPSTQTTMRNRGFQHINTLRNAVEKHDDNFFIHRFPILHYPKNHKRQTEMKSRRERIENMKSVFFTHDTFSGDVIFVLDDVSTTGATLRDAKRVLLDAGARKVYLCSIAR